MAIHSTEYTVHLVLAWEGIRKLESQKLIPHGNQILYMYMYM